MEIDSGVDVNVFLASQKVLMNDDLQSNMKL